jgi:hypothetical protein
MSFKVGDRVRSVYVSTGEGADEVYILSRGEIGTITEDDDSGFLRVSLDNLKFYSKYSGINGILFLEKELELVETECELWDQIESYVI